MKKSLEVFLGVSAISMNAETRRNPAFAKVLIDITPLYRLLSNFSLFLPGTKNN